MILIANIVKTGKLTRHLIISYIADIVKAKHIIMRHLIATKVKGQHESRPGPLGEARDVLFGHLPKIAQLCGASSLLTVF